MDANTTNTAATASPDPSLPQEASGRSILWALATIILYTSSQHSLSGWLLSGDNFSGTLWPHRTSPLVALVDGWYDFLIFWFRWGPWRDRHEGDTSESVRIAPAVAVVRIVGFGVGVLPQSVKLFGMSGVPYTKALAATFLFSSTASILRTLTVHRTTNNTDPPVTVTSESIIGLLRFLGGLLRLFLVLHGLLIVIAWSRIGPSIHLQSDSSLFIIEGFAVLLEFSILVPLLYVVQHLLITLFRGRWLLPRLPWMFPLFFVNLTVPHSLFRDPDSRVGGRVGTLGLQLLMNGIYLTCHVAFVCFAVAFALNWCAGKAYARTEDHNCSPPPLTQLRNFDLTRASQDADSSAPASPRRESQDVTGDIGLASRMEISEQSTEAYLSASHVDWQENETYHGFKASLIKEEREALSLLVDQIFAFGLLSFAFHTLLYADILAFSDSAMVNIEEESRPYRILSSQRRLEEGTSRLVDSFRFADSARLVDNARQAPSEMNTTRGCCCRD